MLSEQFRQGVRKQVRHLRHLAWGAAGLIACHAPAGAQSERRVDLFVDLQTVYDSNIARSSEGQALSRGIEQEDVRFSPSVRADLNIPRGRYAFFLDALVGYDFHARNTRLNRERIEARGGVVSNFGRCATTLEAAIARRQSELQDIVEGPLDNTETSISAAFQSSCPREVGLVPTVGASIRSTRNSKELRKSADFNVKRVEGGLAYVRPSFGELGVFAGYTAAEFPNRLLEVEPGSLINDSFEARDIGVRYARNVGTLLRGSVRVAYTNIDRVAGGSGFDGTTYGATLSGNPLGRLRARLDGDKSVEPANRLGVSYAIEEAYRAEFAYDITPKVLATFGGSLVERELVPAAGGGPAPLLTEEQIRLLFLDLGWQFRERIGFAFTLTNEKRDSNNPLFDYTSTRIGLSTRLAF